MKIKLVFCISRSEPLILYLFGSDDADSVVHNYLERLHVAFFVHLILRNAKPSQPIGLHTLRYAIVGWNDFSSHRGSLTSLYSHLNTEQY